MTDRVERLPTDILNADGSRVTQTSTTNIGAYARARSPPSGWGSSDTRAGPTTAGKRSTLERMERYRRRQSPNWYDHRTGEKLTVWPPSGDPLTPILSSVDNGWLATGLQIVRARSPSSQPGPCALRLDGLRALLRPRGTRSSSTYGRMTRQ